MVEFCSNDRRKAGNESPQVYEFKHLDHGKFMALAKLKTFTLVGIEAHLVDVEVDISPAAVNRTTIVGLADAAVKESTHRVERAMVNSGFSYVDDNILINLAPAELRKQAATFDLPISIGLLVASGQVSSDLLEDYAIVGELSLEGQTRKGRGMLSIAIEAAKIKGLKGILLPRANAQEAAVVEQIHAIPVDSLSHAVSLLSGDLDLEPEESKVEQWFSDHGKYLVDFSDVRGQEMVKRALTIAAAGGHNILMLGPPGSGKTMLSKRVPTILPPLIAEESIETTRIYSAMGKLSEGQPLLAVRPFRSPHHTISDAGLVGGGSTPMPGEISLAHNGVLFLDELPEFNRRTLEVLRQPLEDGVVTISRAMSTITFPADFMLIAALNPCPCGYRGDPRRKCQCSLPQVEKYMSKISGPLVDRIDIHIEVPTVPFKELSSTTEGTSSGEIREGVVDARKIQTQRFASRATRNNAQMSSREIREFCVLDSECQEVLKNSVHDLGLSARAHDKVLRVSRTIADLDGASEIQISHLHEAVNYRLLDRQLWS